MNGQAAVNRGAFPLEENGLFRLFEQISSIYLGFMGFAIAAGNLPFIYNKHKYYLYYRTNYIAYK